MCHGPAFSQAAALARQDSYWNRVLEECIFIYFEPNAVNRGSELEAMFGLIEVTSEWLLWTFKFRYAILFV